ncbi:MAG TPA: choice-of-anchor tandem repeat GloVer-containing protein, partial [Tepidisphaeraceae bacterium]|nr:choice-of-anchor tandem repeat GloVer-containing protein [Tepidisphaeraceae bacterium]
MLGRAGGIRWFLFAVLAVVGAAQVSSAQITDLYNFQGGTGDGAQPDGSFIAVGSTLYGMTSIGGATGNGTIFSYSLLTGQESLLYSFAGVPNDGGHPTGSFIQSSLNPQILYGMTEGGGNGGGTLFSYDIVTGIETPLTTNLDLEEFFREPYGSLVQSGSVLYGTAGGLFEFDTTTNVATPLTNSFRAAVQTPTLSGTMLYGTALLAPGQLGIWSYNLQTGQENTLYLFPNSVNDVSSLTISGDVLYGDTGSSIFSYNLNTSTFQTLISGISAGAGSLLLDGPNLYGASPGGADVFDFNLTSDTLDILGSFPGSGDDGAGPYGGLTLVGTNLYGMTEGAGADNQGTIYSVPIPEPTTIALFTSGIGCLLIGRRSRRWISTSRRLSCV